MPEDPTEVDAEATMDLKSPMTVDEPDGETVEDVARVIPQPHSASNVNGMFTA